MHIKTFIFLLVCLSFENHSLIKCNVYNSFLFDFRLIISAAFCSNVSPFLLSKLIFFTRLEAMYFQTENLLLTASKTAKVIFSRFLSSLTNACPLIFYFSALYSIKYLKLFYTLNR